MARLQLDFPENQFYFTTQLTVRITDINGANHLGNDALISMLSEARAQFLVEHGIEEADQNGTGIIVTDLATTYLREAFARDALVFEVGLMDLNKYGGDIIFRISKSGNGEQVALAKSGFVFYHFESSKVRPMPEDFRVRFPGVNSLEE